jgi:Uma2 family endonuclease
VTEVIEGQRTFTLQEYHRMGEAGVFPPDERVELIRGIVRHTSPKGKRHGIAVRLAMEIFVRRLEGRAGVQIQDALSLEGIRSEPEPDVLVTSALDARETRSEKSDTLLVIEVSDSSLRFDRESKASLYAEADIPEYWIVNLVNDVLEVFRNPEDGVYQTHDVLKPAETVAPLSFPDLELTVRELLP